MVTPVDHPSSSPVCNDITITVQRKRDVNETIPAPQPLPQQQFSILDTSEPHPKKICRREIVSALMDNTGGLPLGSIIQNVMSNETDGSITNSCLLSQLKRLEDENDLVYNYNEEDGTYSLSVHGRVRIVLQELVLTNLKGASVQKVFELVNSKITAGQINYGEVMTALVHGHMTGYYLYEDNLYSLASPYKYIVTNAIEQLANISTEDECEGSSAKAIIEYINEVTTIGTVRNVAIMTTLVSGVNKGIYACNNNIYSLRSNQNINREEWTDLVFMLQEMNQQLKDISKTIISNYEESDEDETNNDNIESSEEDHQPERKKRKTNKRQRNNWNNWNIMFDKLVAYKDEHGDTEVPAKYKSDPKLGSWVSTQRQAHKNGTLSPDCLQKLQSVGFVFNKKEKDWNDMFDKLVAYKAKHRDTEVPAKYKSDPELGTWVSNQRQQYWKANHGTLTDDRVNRLIEIGFVFDKQEKDWNDMFDKLVAYKAKHRDTEVPAKYKSDPKLGSWVSNQRARFGTLSPDCKQKLESIGFVFNKKEKDWNDMFDKLKAYKAKHGDTNVPFRHIPDPELGTWVSNQRQQYKKKNHGTVTGERIQKLVGIGFDWVWKSPSMKWVVQVLKDFHKSTSTEEKKRHCHNPYPTTTKDQTLKKVWPYTVKLRKRVRQGKTIPAWIVEELQKVGFELDPPSRRARRNRIETLILHDLIVNHKHEFNGWDEKIKGTKSRPDAFSVWEYEGKFYIIFKEIDEHRHDDRSIVYEQVRMTLLSVLAKRLGFAGIYFVRTNSAERKEIDAAQQAGVAKLLWSIIKNPQNGVHAWYVDFPIDHHHFLASKGRTITIEDEDEADLAMGEEGEDPMKDLFNSVTAINTGCEAGV